MNFESLGKKQLIKLLTKAEKKVTRLEEQVSLREKIKDEKSQIEHSLRERVKELNCLYQVTELIEKHVENITDGLQGIADLLPISWQYPEVACGCVLFKDRIFKSSPFSESKWLQSAPIYETSEKIGEVRVYYIKKMPEIDEGPFLKEERLLINAVAKHIGKAVERINAKKELEVERESLKNMNITLREVLSRIKDEQKEAGRSIQANADKVIIPILHALENDVSQEQKKYITLIKKNFEEITSPFISQLSQEFMSLTPSEIQICNMIKNGLSTKEIAKLRHISQATVNRHREHIRKKLAIQNRKVNLSTFLRTYMTGS